MSNKCSNFVASNRITNNLIKKDMKVKVMTLAWAMVKHYGFSMSEAMILAWKNIKLKKRLADGVVKFTYRKVDGTLRDATGTISAAIVPTVNGKNKKAHNNLVQVYFDTTKGEWRSFKKENLVSVV